MQVCTMDLDVLGTPSILDRKDGKSFLEPVRRFGIACIGKTSGSCRSCYQTQYTGVCLWRWETRSIAQIIWWAHLKVNVVEGASMFIEEVWKLEIFSQLSIPFLWNIVVSGSSSLTRQKEA